MCFLSAGSLLCPQWAVAQTQPHRAEYALRLGTAVNAARVGSAVQDLTLTCDGWHLKRDIKGEIALSASWKMNVASQLDGERRTHGKVQRAGKELRAEIVSPTGPAQLLLPPPTLMPVALIDHLIERLRGGSTTFPAVAFDAEATGDAFLIDVTPMDPGAIRGRRPNDKPVAVPGKSWAASMSFTRGGNQEQKPLFTISAQVFESGILDRLTVETPMATVTADLQALEMRKPPACPPSPVPTKGL
jgi:hypothetical protein